MLATKAAIAMIMQHNIGIGEGYSAISGAKTELILPVKLLALMTSPMYYVSK